MKNNTHMGDQNILFIEFLNKKHKLFKHEQQETHLDHVTLLNILGFVHLPEKVLDKYFEIKGVLNLITCSMGFFFGSGGWNFNTLSWILRVLQNVVH
jgi:hypothetical protein